MMESCVYKGRKYFIQSTGRYFSYRNRSDSRERLLHRFIYSEAHGDIPKGYAIHHKDGNWRNNALSNLEAVPHGQHSREHMLELHKTKKFRRSSLSGLRMGRAKAAEWHGSPAGLAWHSQNGLNAWKNRRLSTVLCTVCGKKVKTPFPTRTRVCGRQCAQKGCYAKQKTEPKVCAFCGKDFLANKYRNVECCSKVCSNRKRVGQIYNPLAETAAGR